MADKNKGQQQNTGDMDQENMDAQRGSQAGGRQNDDMETGGEQTGSGQTTRQGGQGGQQGSQGGQGGGQGSQAPGRNT